MARKYNKDGSPKGKKNPAGGLWVSPSIIGAASKARRKPNRERLLHPTPDMVVHLTMHPGTGGSF